MMIILVGFFQIMGAVSFVLGFFFGLEWLMLVGGMMVVADDIREIAHGYLNPVIPILLAVVGAIIFSPWYVGVFWSSALFKLLSQPAHRRNIFLKPNRVLLVRASH